MRAMLESIKMFMNTVKPVHNEVTNSAEPLCWRMDFTRKALFIHDKPYIVISNFVTEYGPVLL